MLNEVFGNVELSEAEMQTLIWLVKRAENTVANVVSAIRKAMTSDASGGNCSPVRRAGKGLRSASVGAEQTSTGRLAPPEGAKAAFDGRNGCRKCFCVTFDESNKAYAPYPALITTRQGRKESY